MTSGRKESVRRHIRNPRIHSGNARIIPYIEHVAGLQVGIYQPIHNLYRQRHRESDQSLLGSEASNTLEDKIYRRVQEKTLDKIADGIVNRQWTFNHTPRRNRKSSPAAAKISRPTYLKQDVFGIGEYICESCLDIKPMIFPYSDDAKSSHNSFRIYPIQSCIGCSSKMSSQQKRYYLNYNKIRGIAPILMNWIKVLWSENNEMKLIAFMLPGSKISSQGDNPSRLDASGSLAVSRIRVTDQDSDHSSFKKTIILRKEELNIEDIEPRATDHDSSVPFAAIDSSPILFAINESEYTITSENDLYSFLRYTKFKTFGLFRTKIFDSSSTSNFDTYRYFLVILVPSEYALGMKYACEVVNQEIVTDSP